MEDVMECLRLLDVCINNGLHYLPEDPYTLGIFFTLGDEYQDCPSRIYRHIPMLPHKLDQLHKFRPFFWSGGSGCLLLQVRLLLDTLII